MKILTITSLLAVSAIAQNLAPTGAWNAPLHIIPQNSNTAVASTSMVGNTELTTSGSTSYTWTLGQAGTTGFEAAKWFIANATGSGSITITTTTSTYSGCSSSGSSLTISSGQSRRITSDGTNWIVDGCGGASSGGTVTSVVGASPITGTVTGAGSLSCPTCATSAAPLANTQIMTGAGSQGTQTPSSVATVDSSGNLHALTVTTVDTAHNGGVNMLGATSGAVALSVSNVAGTAVTYVIPSYGMTGQVISDNGPITCPTDLPAGYPTTCHQLLWVAAGSSISPCSIVSSGISCPGPLQSSGTGAGIDALAPGTQSLAGLPTNAVGIISPASVTGQHILQLPAVAATGAQVPIIGAESAGIAPMTYAGTTGTGSVVMNGAPTVNNLTVTGSCTGCGSSPPSINSMVWPQMDSSGYLVMTTNTVYCRQMVAPVSETLNRAVSVMSLGLGHVSFGVYQNGSLMSGGQGAIITAPGTNAAFASSFGPLPLPPSTGSISYSVCVTSDGSADHIFSDAGTSTLYGLYNVGLSSPNLVYYTCANPSVSGAMPSTCGTQTAIASGISLFSMNLY